jgi:hypothetical protein
MKFVVSYSVWEDSDYIVTIRPENEKLWRAVPIGPAISKDEARRVAEWLQSALTELTKIFDNIQRQAEHAALLRGTRLGLVEGFCWAREEMSNADIERLAAGIVARLESDGQEAPALSE